MLRKTLVAGVMEVINVIETSGILDVLAPAGSEKGRLEPALAIRAFHNYAVGARSFSDSAKSIAKIFQLEKLEDPTFWVQTLGSDNGPKASIYRTLMHINSELPKTLELLAQDTVDTPNLSGRPEDRIDSIAHLSVQLIEKDGSFSTVARLIDALSACQEIYDALAKMFDQSGIPLAVGAIDSGSDKSFDLFGAAALMKEFRELVISLWGLVVFHRQTKLGKQLELIAASLPILERINELEQQEKLGREQAQIIRNGIVDGSMKFIASGLIIEGLAAHTAQDPRKLLAPEPKLLTGPNRQEQKIGRKRGQSSESNLASSEQAGKTGTLSDEDLDRLADRITKRQGRSDPNTNPAE